MKLRASIECPKRGYSDHRGGAVMKVKSICFSILALLLLGAGIAFYGQNIRGSIVGNVTDSSGAVVPGAQITVKNEGTGIEVRTTTGAGGTYTVPDLLAGVYEVSAAKEGFKTYRVSGIRLLSAQTSRQDIMLELGQLAQTVNGIRTSSRWQGGVGNFTYVWSEERISLANLPSIGTL